MTMLEELRRSGVRQVLVVSGDSDPIPTGLRDLWSSGFRSSLTFVADSQDATEKIRVQIDELDDLNAVALLRMRFEQVTAEIIDRFSAVYPEDRIVIRVRSRSGDLSTLDITELEEPERPVLGYYDIIQERDLSLLMPDQLSEEEFASFFENPEASWRPYAAHLPWERSVKSKEKFGTLLKKLDASGPEENCISYVIAEPGAGGTTYTRALAWQYAQQGYPVLVAKTLPFVPDALSLGNFLNRVRLECELPNQELATHDVKGAEVRGIEGRPPQMTRYEVPWIIVFDRIHWEYRDNELRRFRNEMEKQGRPVCLLIVSGPILELAYFDTSVFHQIGELNHALDHDEARALGHHLNQFLRVYGKPREVWQWDKFFKEHSIRYLEGIAAFWVTLSFWIQGQYDLSESVQVWMYRCFQERIKTESMKMAILEIAALSTERLPIPDGLLSVSKGEWPVSHLLEDNRANLGPLGLVRISAAGERYWALAHDILGRFLITALFHDFPTRKSMGYGNAKDPEHLRFMLLREISKKRELGEVAFREFGNDFASGIFKIDPDHGHETFAPFWREVLDALDAMPRSLQDSSRVFRHHSAVSRRRIAKFDERFYGVSNNDKLKLLTKAIEDINYALDSIEFASGSEPNINLYNSLAHAYHDLAEAEEARGATAEVVIQLRKLANNATRKAYEENPTNSFVIETYIRDLLSVARSHPGQTIECCVEALGILFSALSSNEESYRRAQLGDLADKVLSSLFDHAADVRATVEPNSPIEVLTKAWNVLAQGVDCTSGTALSDLPEQNRSQAIEVLSKHAGLGNMQILRLSYDLISTTYPQDFKWQLEYLEQLQHTDYRLSPQMRLEYGILLYQTNRPKEGDSAFRALRKLWRESEQFVGVPSRLRWLRSNDGKGVAILQAFVGSDRDLRPMARVPKFQNILVPFRSEEFGIRNVHPGAVLSCRVSFGHNGPFLRPVTAKIN